MGRPKTISDRNVLAIARDVFRKSGHAVSTREIARAAGLSEAVLYQRFGSKDGLFFAAMIPYPPDIATLLDPRDPPGTGLGYVRGVVERMAAYFAEVLPLAIHVMTHPTFDLAAFVGSGPMAATHQLELELAKRLRLLEQRGWIAKSSAGAAARLFTSLAHDWALRGILSGSDKAPDRRALLSCIDVAWQGIAPQDAKTAASASKRAVRHT